MPVPPLIGSYTPPAVRRGDRMTCLYRDADCVITTMHDGPIPWPRCRAVDARGGSGLLVDETLLRAIRTESAAALMHWFGVGSKAVWGWRRKFVGGAGKFRTEGSKAAHAKASRAGSEATKMREWSAAERKAKATVSKRLGLVPLARWTPERGGWTAAEVRLLRGKLTDIEIAARTGRSVDAVRAKRSRLMAADSRASDRATSARRCCPSFALLNQATAATPCV